MKEMDGQSRHGVGKVSKGRICERTTKADVVKSLRLSSPLTLSRRPSSHGPRRYACRASTPDNELCDGWLRDGGRKVSRGTLCKAGTRAHQNSQRQIFWLQRFLILDDEQRTNGSAHATSDDPQPSRLRFPRSSPTNPLHQARPPAHLLPKSTTAGPQSSRRHAQRRAGKRERRREARPRDVSHLVRVHGAETTGSSPRFGDRRRRGDVRVRRHWMTATEAWQSDSATTSRTMASWWGGTPSASG